MKIIEIQLNEGLKLLESHALVAQLFKIASSTASDQLRNIDITNLTADDLNRLADENVEKLFGKR